MSDFHCVTTWSKFDVKWTGVAFFTLAELVRPKPEVKHVLFASYDGYTTNVRLDDVMDDDVLIATHYDGKPLTARARRPRPRHHPEALRLERREVHPRDRIRRGRQTRLLGSARLQQHRRSLDRGSVFLNAEGPLRRTAALSCLLLALVSTTLRADFHEFQEVPADAALAAALTRTAEATLREFPRLTAENLALSVIDLTKPTRPSRADYHGDAPFYPASVMKLFVMVEIFRQGKHTPGDRSRAARNDPPL